MSDPDEAIGAAYDAVRAEGEDYHGMAMPRRISYLISPDGRIARSYDLQGRDLSEHAAEVLADIVALS